MEERKLRKDHIGNLIMKRFPWFEIILIVVVMSISLYAALSDGHNLSVRWFVRDDAYYYFKVAQNISEGHGSTFDGINKTNGYHPLWMLICIPIFALARFDLILPLRVLLVVMSGLSVATADTSLSPDRQGIHTGIGCDSRLVLGLQSSDQRVQCTNRDWKRASPHSSLFCWPTKCTASK